MDNCFVEHLQATASVDKFFCLAFWLSTPFLFVCEISFSLGVTKFFLPEVWKSFFEGILKKVVIF